MAAASDDDLRAVDTFLAGAKRLEGGLPEWVASERPDDVTANWNIVDDLDIVRGSLRFRLSRLAVDFPSVSLIFRQNCVWRVDLVPPGNLKRNPPWASEFGLPASFRGSHCHAWADNRAYIGRAGWVGLPAHRPVEPALRRVRQMLPWIADHVGIQLTPEQRTFDAPARAQLFEG